MKNKKNYVLTLRSRIKYSLPKGFYNPFFLNRSTKYLICLQYKKKILEVIGVINDTNLFYYSKSRRSILINFFNKKGLFVWITENSARGLFVPKKLNFLLSNPEDFI